MSIGGTCRHGHQWTEDNTYVRLARNGRECRACQRERARRNAERGYVPRRSHIAQLNDAAWLRERYEARRLTTHEIAAELGCSHTTVRLGLLRHGIEARPAGRRPTG
jgi:hypothetical protein